MSGQGNSARGCGYQGGAQGGRRGGRGGQNGRRCGRGGRDIQHHPCVYSNSPYWQDEFNFQSAIRSDSLRKVLETPGPFSPPGSEKRGIIQDWLISLFRILILYGWFRDLGRRYWEIVAEDFGWTVHECQTIVSIYVAAREAYTKAPPSDLIAFHDRESTLLIRLVDQYIAAKHLQEQPAPSLTPSLIEATRKVWRNYDRRALLMSAPSPPPFPVDVDWSLDGLFQAGPPQQPARRERSRSPIPEARAIDNYRARSPLQASAPPEGGAEEAEEASSQIEDAPRVKQEDDIRPLPQVPQPVAERPVLDPEAAAATKELRETFSTTGALQTELYVLFHKIVNDPRLSAQQKAKVQRRMANIICIGEQYDEDAKEA